MKYKIVLKTDYWHAARHSLFKGNTTVTTKTGLSLKEAQSALLEMLNMDYETNYTNWGLARIHKFNYTTTYKDGTRSYTWDYYTASIEKEENNE